MPSLLAPRVCLLRAGWTTLVLGMSALGCTKASEPEAPPAVVGSAPEATVPSPPTASADALIREVVANKAQMGLPRAFDGYTVEDVTASSGLLTFHTRLDTPRAPGLDTLRTQAVLAPVLAPRVCGEPTSRAILDRGGVYAYRFVDVGGQYVTKVYLTSADCARAAAP